jgi:hypothetical protein
VRTRVYAKYKIKKKNIFVKGIDKAPGSRYNTFVILRQQVPGKSDAFPAEVALNTLLMYFTRLMYCGPFSVWRERIFIFV